MYQGFIELKDGDVKEVYANTEEMLYIEVGIIKNDNKDSISKISLLKEDVIEVFTYNNKNNRK